MKRLRTARSTRALPLLLLFLLTWSAASEPVEREVIGTFDAPVSGVQITAYLDPTTGEKWLEDSQGRRYADLDELRWEELSRLGDPASRIAPALQTLLEDPETADQPVSVVLVLRDQPLHDVAAELREVLSLDVARIMAPARAVWARIEDDLPPWAERARLDVAAQYELERAAMTEEERIVVQHAVASTRTCIRRFREQALARAAPRCEASRARVLDMLPDLEVTGESDLLNSLFVTMSPSDLPGILGACSEIWSALPALTYSIDLDKSVPTIGASSFWAGGWTGSGVGVAVLDTGMDNLHPSIKAAITSEKVFLGNAKYSSFFNDDATKTDDLQGHGTHVAGTASGRNSTYSGVAKGSSLVNAKCFYRKADGGASGTTTDIFNATVWAVTKADVLNCSWGSAGGTGSSAVARLYDAIAHDLAIATAVAAGNSGSSSGTIDTPGDAFNVFTVGGCNDKGTTSPSDDAIASWSSRGPTNDGRRKPTLMGPGTSIYASSHNWEGTSPDFVNKSGTSMATPHMAGAIAVVLDYKSSYTPQAIKALFVNTCMNTSPYPTSPDNNWGWGGLDLSAAYARRGDVIEATFTSSNGASLYYTRSSSLSSGDRATVAWNRQVTYSATSWPGAACTLTDLDLYLYDGTTGVAKKSSTSTVNPVEQVKAASTIATPILRVKRGSFPTGVSTEPFALAHPSGFSAANPPALACTYSGVTSPISINTTFTMTVTVANSGGIPAIAPSVALTLPTGWTLVSGSNPQTLATITASGSKTATFSIKSPSTAKSGTFSVVASSTCFGGTFASTAATKTQQVTAAVPTGTVSINGGAAWTNSSTVTLTLAATSSNSTVTNMRFSNDGSTWSAWETYGTSKSWTLASGEGTRTAYAQFRDALGKSSATATDTISVDTTVPTGTLSIAGGASYVGSTSVTLTQSAADTGGSGVADMRFSNDGTTWSTWETYGTSKSWTLTS
jgi:subtilisin family serine protease